MRDSISLIYSIYRERGTLTSCFFSKEGNRNEMMFAQCWTLTFLKTTYLETVLLVKVKRMGLCYLTVSQKYKLCDVLVTEKTCSKCPCSI